MFNTLRHFWLLCLMLAFCLQSTVAPAQSFAMAWQYGDVKTTVVPHQEHQSSAVQSVACHEDMLPSSTNLSQSDFSFGAKCSHCAACIMTAALPSYDIGLSMQVYGSDALIVFIPQSFVSYIAEVLDPPPRQLI